MIKFSNKCILHREIDHLLNKFDSDYFTSSELQIKTLDMPKNISEITKKILYIVSKYLLLQYKSHKSLKYKYENSILSKSFLFTEQYLP